MGYPFHLGDTLLSALKRLKTYYCLDHKHGLVLSKWKVYCRCLDLWLQADTYATLGQLDQEYDYNECVYKKISLKADNSCFVSFK